jgi:hypothetical protein
MRRDAAPSPATPRCRAGPAVDVRPSPSRAPSDDCKRRRHPLRRPPLPSRCRRAPSRVDPAWPSTRGSTRFGGGYVGRRRLLRVVGVPHHRPAGERVHAQRSDLPACRRPAAAPTWPTGDPLVPIVAVLLEVVVAASLAASVLLTPQLGPGAYDATHTRTITYHGAQHLTSAFSRQLGPELDVLLPDDLATR